MEEWSRACYKDGKSSRAKRVVWKLSNTKCPVEGRSEQEKRCFAAVGPAGVSVA